MLAPRRRRGCAEARLPSGSDLAQRFLSRVGGWNDQLPVRLSETKLLRMGPEAALTQPGVISFQGGARSGQSVTLGEQTGSALAKQALSVCTRSSVTSESVPGQHLTYLTSTHRALTMCRKVTYALL